MYRNDCNLSCSAIYALRDIKEGEELIISYGDISPCQFFLKYSAIPLDLFQLNKPEMIGLLCPPYMIPNNDNDNKRRILSLENSNYPLNDLKNGNIYITILSPEEYYTNIKGNETDSVAALRQFLLITYIATDAEVEIRIKTGRIRCVYSQEQTCHALCEVLDYNLSILNNNDPTNNTSNMSSSSKKEYDQSNRTDITYWEKIALLSRICQRETLLMWRYHFYRRFKVLTPDYNSVIRNNKPLSLNDDDVFSGCCKICRRTYPIMKCTKCKLAIYCSRSHQIYDWKAGHKLVCKTTTHQEE